MKIVTIIGARPQFVKASVVSRTISDNPNMNEIIIHTGQHFDTAMSDVFFDELNLPRPNYQLGIHGISHGAMTGRMLIEIERIIQKERPDLALVYGDTNSTLAGALAAAKLHIPVAHVEAGLRSYNMKMPEEINRILTDQISDLLFCPTDTAVRNLKKEGFDLRTVNILKVGDVMQDSALLFSKYAFPPETLEVDEGFILVTLHRAENTDDQGCMLRICAALNRLHKEVAPVVFPMHPRTRKAISEMNLDLDVISLQPVGYLEMLWLLAHCGLVLTDSGGLQKEAYFFGKACVTMRGQTEWTELVEAEANELVGTDEERIIRSVKENFNRKVRDDKGLYGGGTAAAKIVDYLITSQY